MYRALSDGGQEPVDGILRVYYFGRLYLHTVLVIDLLGPSLEDMFRERNRKFTLKTVAILAKRMVCICRRSLPELVDFNILPSYVWWSLFTRRDWCIEISSLKISCLGDRERQPPTRYTSSISEWPNDTGTLRPRDTFHITRRSRS